MIKPFSLDNKDLGWSIYVGGMYGAGKTTLIGDMLKYEQQYGKVAYVMTPTEGDEDKGGWQSIVGLGLGDIAYCPKTFEELQELRTYFKQEGFRAVGCDTLSGLARLVKIKVLGEDRMPKTSFKVNEYGEVVNEFVSFTRLWNNCAKYVLNVAPVSIVFDDDQTGNKADIEDRDGSTARMRAIMDWQKLQMVIPGLHDLCFAIECEGVNTTSRRTLMTQQGKKWATKQRLAKGQRISKNLVLEDDLKNWERLINCLPKEKS